jgi:hypothetical protein
MRYLRKLQNVNPRQGVYYNVSIPSEFSPMFAGTSMAIIEPLPSGRGLVILPADIKPME